MLNEGTWTFRHAPLGAGGFVCGMDIASDGTMVHWADVANGYIREPGDARWRVMFDASTLDAANHTPWLGGTTTTDDGVYTARFWPSDPNKLYAIWYGWRWFSDDKGLSWTKCPVPARECETNGNATGSGDYAARRYTKAMDVHPTDGLTAIYGDNGVGAYYTTDGFATETQVTGLSAGTAGLKLLVGINQADPNYVYIAVPGVGIYRSTTGVAGTFSLMASSPTSITCMHIGPSGKVYIVTTTGTHRLQTCPHGSTTFSVVTGSSTCDQVAIDPFDEDHLAVVEVNGGFIGQSYDAGATWVFANRNSTSGSEWYRGDGEISWFSNRSKQMFPAQAMFDPIVQGKLWICEGVGINWSTCPAEGVDPTEADPWLVHDYSLGNEELIAVGGRSIPGHPMMLTCWDKPIWRIADPYNWRNMWAVPTAVDDIFPGGTVIIGHAIDYAADNPLFQVAVVGQNGTNTDGYSINGGRSFTEFPTKCAGFGGDVAVLSETNFIRTATNNAKGQYTLDGGATWNDLTFSGSVLTHWSTQQEIPRQTMAVDRERPGHVAFLTSNAAAFTSAFPGKTGVWKSTDGGVTTSMVYTGVIQTDAHPSGGGTSSQSVNNFFSYVPGHAGELIYADLTPNNTANCICLSDDDAVTWTDADPLIRAVQGVGLGKAYPGSDYPAVYFYGQYDGDWGLWGSFDWFATPPTLIAEKPLNFLGSITSVIPDLNVFGRVYVGISGMAFAVCDYRKTFNMVADSDGPSPGPPAGYDIFTMLMDSLGASTGATNTEAARDPVLDAPVADTAQLVCYDQEPDYGSIRYNTAPTWHVDGSYAPSNLDGRLSVAEDMLRRYQSITSAWNRSSAVIPCGDGGSSLLSAGSADWDPAGPGTNLTTARDLHNSGVTQFLASHPQSRVRGIWICLTSNDVNGGTYNSTNIRNAWVALIDYVRANFNGVDDETVFIISGPVGPTGGTMDTARTDAAWAATQRPNCYYVNAPFPTASGDNLHPSRTENRTWGTDTADAIYAAPEPATVADFTIPPANGVALDTATDSDPVVVMVGYGETVSASITGGTFSINGGSFSSATRDVIWGDEIVVRVQSSASNSTLTSAELTIGTKSADFNVTTEGVAGTSYLVTTDPGSAYFDNGDLRFSASGVITETP